MSIMSSKKSLFLAASSVAVSPKVRSSLSRLYSLHNLFLHSIYNPPHIKNIRFSTAAQTTVFQSESHEKDRSFDYQHNPSDRFYTAGNPNPTEFQQNPSVNYGENPRKLGFFGGRTSETPHNQDAASSVVGGGGNSGYFQENPIENYRGNVGDLLQRNHVRKNQNFNAVHQEYPKSVQGNPVGFENAKVSQQNPSGYYPENVQCQTSYGVYREDPRVVQQGPGSVSGQKYMEFQRTQNGYYGGNVSELQKNPNAYQFQRNDSGYHQESSGGGFQQNPTWSHQRGVGDFQGSSNVTLASESVETTESSQYKGTLEELDSLCKEGKVKEAVEVLGLLDKQGIKLDLQRYFQLMNACGEASSLQEAKAVHDHLIRSLVDVKVSVYNKILDMYAKCGSLSDAYEVFEKMPERNLTTWDTMITGLAKNGLGEDAIDLFTRFKEAGLRPDGQMFFGVFSACSILYDIDEGMLHLESMSKVYGIIPSREHYVSVVDMLGSTGYLDEAMEFIEKMSFEPSVEVWETMMNLCRVHGNTELGDRCAQIVEHLDPSRLTDQSKAGLVPVKPSDIAKEKEKRKLSAQNLLEVRSRVHEYRAGDTSHPEKDKIYALLRGMGAQMREVGYVPETRFVLHDIDQEGKEEALLAHSERLAVSYGLISSPARSPIRIIKNLRVCGDCHNALKIISKLVGRELIIRDAKRFHHFKDGLCSCRDYW